MVNSTKASFPTASEGIYIYLHLFFRAQSLNCYFADDVSLLSIILDCNPVVWSKYSANPDSITLLQAIEHLLIFINAYLSLKHDNQLSVIATLNNKRYVWVIVLMRLDSESALNCS
jgi:hypothetical protein